jgi:hypothetical protein
MEQSTVSHLDPTYSLTPTLQPTFDPSQLHHFHTHQQQQFLQQRSAHLTEMRPVFYPDTFGNPLQNMMRTAQWPQGQGQQAQSAAQQNQHAQMAQLNDQVETMQRLEAVRRANQGRTQQSGQAQQLHQFHNAQQMHQTQQAQRGQQCQRVQAQQMQQTFNPAQFDFTSIDLQVPMATWQSQGMAPAAQSSPSGSQFRSAYATPPSSQPSPASYGRMQTPAVQSPQGQVLRTPVMAPKTRNKAASSIDLRTPPPTQERNDTPHVNTPGTASGQVHSRSNLLSAAASAMSGAGLQTPSGGRGQPVRIPASHPTPPVSQGQKRKADKTAQSSSPSKRQATAGSPGNNARGQVPIVDPAEEFRKQQLLHQKQQQALKLRQQQQAQKVRENAAAAAKRKKDEEFAAKAAVAAEAEKKRKQAAIEAAEQKRKYEEHQARFKEQAEEFRISQTERLERERKALRKEELRKDPSALFRYYNEYLQYFPLSTGEQPSRYHSRLLANRMNFGNDEEQALAILYAKDHWELYLEFPRDVKDAAQWQREDLAKRAGTTTAVVDQTASKV